MEEPVDALMAPYERVTREWMSARGADLDAQATIHLLDRTSIDVLAAMEAEVLRPLQLSYPKFMLLMTLLISGPRETRELANILRITRPAAVSIVESLERCGLVRRRHSSNDRRLVSVKITPAGSALAEEAQAAWHECEKSVTSVLTRDEQRTLAALMRRLHCGVYQSGRLGSPVAHPVTLWAHERDDA